MASSYSEMWMERACYHMRGILGNNNTAEYNGQKGAVMVVCFWLVVGESF